MLHGHARWIMLRAFQQLGASSLTSGSAALVSAAAKRTVEHRTTSAQVRAPALLFLT